MLGVERKRKEQLLLAFLNDSELFDSLCSQSVSLQQKNIKERLHYIQDILQSGTYGLSCREINKIQSAFGSYNTFGRYNTILEKLWKVNNSLAIFEYKQNIVSCLLEGIDIKQTVKEKPSTTLTPLLETVRSLRLEEKAKKIQLAELNGTEKEKEIFEKSFAQLKNKFALPAKDELYQKVAELLEKGLSVEEIYKELFHTFNEQINHLRQRIKLVNKKLSIPDEAKVENRTMLTEKDEILLQTWVEEIRDSSKKALVNIQDKLDQSHEKLQQKKIKYMQTYREEAQRLILEQHTLQSNSKTKQYELIRLGQVNQQEKRTYQFLIELYLTGLYSKEELQNYLNYLQWTNGEPTIPNIKGLLENENYICEIFGTKIWNEIIQHENYINNLENPKDEELILRDPFLRKYLPKNKIYGTIEEYDYLKWVDQIVQIQSCASEEISNSLSEEINSIMKNLNINLKKNHLAKANFICKIADYKIMYSAGHNEIANRFNVPIGTIHYFLTDKLQEIDPAKFLIVQSINDQKERKKGLSEDQLELIETVNQLEARGYNSTMIAYLMNDSVDNVNIRRKQAKYLNQKTLKK